MGNPTWQHVFNLNEVDHKRLEEMRKQGVKIIDIVRLGMKLYEEEILKKGGKDK